MTIFYSDVEPLSQYSPATLYLSPATGILNENPELAKWLVELSDLMGWQLTTGLEGFKKECKIYIV